MIILFYDVRGSGYMLARLIRRNRTKLLLCTDGSIVTADIALIQRFLNEFKTIETISGTPYRRWDIGIAPNDTPQRNEAMRSYIGITLAVVEDDHTLHIFDPELFVGALAFTNPDEFLTVTEYATMNERCSTEVTRHCTNQRISGAIRKGDRWFIPIGAKYPEDARKK